MANKPFENTRMLCTINLHPSLFQWHPNPPHEGLLEQPIKAVYREGDTTIIVFQINSIQYELHLKENNHDKVA